MPTKLLEYRLTIRNQADDGDLLVLSSRAGDANCLLSLEPDIEGQSIDPIMGETTVGTVRWQAIDRDDGGVTRTITSLIADADARNQMLSNKCIGRWAEDGGSFTIFHTGYLNSIRLATALEFEFTVGDTDRREQTAELFRTVTPAFPGGSCILGGPIVANPPVAWTGTPQRAWGPVSDFGPCRFTVISNPSGLVNPTTRVTLSLVSGNLPPRYLGQQGVFNGKIPNPAEYIDGLARPYFVPDGTGRYATNSSQQSQPWGAFGVRNADGSMVANLVVEMDPVAGGSTIFSFPIAQATKKASETLPIPPSTDFPIGDESALVANSNDWLIVDWDVGTMGAQPSNGTLYDVIVYPSVVDEKNPLHLGGHPIDLHTAANVQEDIPYDTASAASTKTALGPLYYELRITSSMPYKDFVAMLKKSAGYATRYNTDGEQEFFPTRTTQPASVGDITIDDLVSDEDG